DGVAVPEFVTNEFAVAPLVSRLIVPAPLVITIVPPVLVKFAHTGANPVLPISNCPLVPFDDDNTPVPLDCTTPRPSELNVMVPAAVIPPAVTVKPPAVIVSPPPLIVNPTPESGVLIVTLPAL